jgi:hypothetical protein
MGEIREYTAKELEQFWFEAVRDCGWQREEEDGEDFSEPNPVGEDDTLGPYQYLYFSNQELGLEYTDAWWDGPAGSDTFHGVTTIQRIADGATLWTMHYAGWMKSEAEKLVRAAIRSAVQNGIFVGGRGSEIHISDDICYINTCDGGFEAFLGVEYCTRLVTTARISEVHYSGGVMSRLIKS